MSKTTTALATAALAAAGIGGYIATDALLDDHPAPVSLVAVADAPAPAGKETSIFDDIDRKLDPFRHIDAIVKPPPPPIPAKVLEKAIAATIPDQIMAEAIARAMIAREALVGKSIAGINSLVPLIPEAAPGLPVIEQAQRLYTILKRAGLRTIPYYASGSPAWVRWRQLLADPLATDADWIAFYQSLSTAALA
ncbi:hypothetical protein OPIT5_29255 [Opitutaceae bacterium TAV5]|nr:hypothetical protein OPIT5_21865 [Opitutaceae bacterium TAV5]AHF93675.1 hypothetical protein OPIT5_29255 [Opitutaceae bacterium TAV5]